MTVRLGIIGAGGIGNVHADAAVAAGSTVTAICDLIPSRAEQLAGRVGAELWTTSAADVFASDDVDAVVIAVPNRSHKPLAIEALNAGCDVLLEKPMALSVAECNDIMAVASGSDRIVQLGFVCRQAPTARAVAGLIASGRLGRLYHAKAMLHRRRGIPGLGGWFTTRSESGGGVLIDLGVHVIDLVRHLAGSPDAVRVSGSCTSTFGNPIDGYTFSDMWAGPPDPDGTFDVEDAATALIRFDGGLTLDLSVSWAANLPEGILPDGIMLLGEKGGCFFDIWGSRLEVATEAGGLLEDTRPQVGVAEPWADGWRHQHEDFARHVEGRTSPTASVEDGRAVQAILDAIYASSDAGAEVAV